MARPVAHDLGYSPCRPHRSLPSLQSPGADLDHSSETLEDPSTSAYELWDDFTDQQVQECTSDLVAGALQPAATRDSGEFYGCFPMSCKTLQHRGIRRGAGKKSGPQRLVDVESLTKSAPKPTPWQVTQSPWRTPRAHNPQSSNSWQPPEGKEEPTLALPKPWGS